MVADTWVADTWVADTWAANTWVADTWVADTWASDMCAADTYAADGKSSFLAFAIEATEPGSGADLLEAEEDAGEVSGGPDEEEPAGEVGVVAAGVSGASGVTGALR